MRIVPAMASTLRGLSFGIAELVLIRSWAEARGLRMVVRLDHGTETEEYEEVLVFRSETSEPCRWMMWRDERSVYVQPLLGRTQRYGSVADAVDALSPRRGIIVTDVEAVRWPSQAARSENGRPACDGEGGGAE